MRLLLEERAGIAFLSTVRMALVLNLGKINSAYSSLTLVISVAKVQYLVNELLAKSCENNDIGTLT